jgi:phospholipid/cholesterol/gamma-HCH transport system substrate-binding protein
MVKLKIDKYIDFTVGVFMLMGIIAIVFLIFKVSGLNQHINGDGFHVTASFTDIGGLKVRAPVTIAGVRVGEVTDITLTPNDFNAKVTLLIKQTARIPYTDVSARILTEGLIGSNYISITPGFDDDAKHPYLRDGDVIAKTQEAIILENLIGQLIFNINKK